MTTPDELIATTDEAALNRMRAVSKLMDDAVPIPGTNRSVGLDPLLSIDPSPVGDLVGGAVSLYIVAESANLGVPYTTLVKMLGNVAVDLGIGSVPVLGVLLDAVWKANERNLKLVEEYVEERSDLDFEDEGEGEDFVSIDVQDA